MSRYLPLPLALCWVLLLSSVGWTAWYTPVEWGVSAYYHTDLDVDGANLEGSGLMVSFASRLAQDRCFTLHLRMEAMLGGLWGHGHGLEAAVVPGLRLYFGSARVRPYLEGGVGPEINALRIRELGTAFNFLSYGGGGLRFVLSKGMNLELGYRVRHISNAGISEQNHGVTSQQVQVGLSFPF